MRGKFITLEGVDGAGKSTHIPAIVAALEARGHRVVSTREPGGTELGERLRALLLHQNMRAETEALLMFAARNEHIAAVIEPALASGAYVLSDRFSDASFAYQAGGRSVSAARIEQLEAWVHPGLQPDLTLLFDVPVAVSMARLQQARDPDKFERLDPEFFARVRAAYLQRAERFPARFRIVDGSLPVAQVARAVMQILAEFC